MILLEIEKGQKKKKRVLGNTLFLEHNERFWLNDVDARKVGRLTLTELAQPPG